MKHGVWWGFEGGGGSREGWRVFGHRPLLMKQEGGQVFVW
jgi:hypothetical protein